jgi:hypothetical protein
LLFSRIASKGFEVSKDIYELSFLAEVVTSFMKELAPTGDDADPESILDAVEAQHGIMVKERSGEYKFSHLTFQEFYTARAIVDSSDPTMLTRVLVAHMGDPRWNEVLLIGAGLQKDAALCLPLEECAGCVANSPS